MEFDYTPRQKKDYDVGDVGVIHHIFGGKTLYTILIPGIDFITVYKEEFIIIKKGNKNEEL